MPDPLFSIVTPCSPKRYATTLPRAIASVKRQTIVDWEHILILNAGEEQAFWDAYGPYAGIAADLRQQMITAPPNPGWPDIGAWNFRHGAEQTRGKYVAWLCDDDEYLPHHLSTHLRYLEAGVDFTVSRTAFYVQGEPQMIVGDNTFALSHLDSNGVVSRRELLKDGLWRDTGKWDADWDMVQQWLAAGHQGTFIDIVTGLHHNGWMARNRNLDDNVC